MSIKKSQAIRKCFNLQISSLAFGLRWAQKTKPCFVTLRTFFSSTAGHIFSVNFINRNNPAKPNCHMSIKKSQAKCTEYRTAGHLVF